MQLRLHERHHELFWRWMKNEDVKLSDDLHDEFVEAEYQLEAAKERVDRMNEGRHGEG